jgi:hypothetical protein
VVDVVELVSQLRPADQVEVVRNFTAIVKDEPASSANQTDYLDAMRAYSGNRIDIRVGRFKPKTIDRCKVCRREFLCSCPTTYLSYEEKETDVALGVAMVEDAAARVGDLTLLASADSDLMPAVASVKRIDPNRPVYVAMPPSRSPRVVRFQGVGWFLIREAALAAAQLPSRVVDPATARQYARPAKWS